LGLLYYDLYCVQVIAYEYFVPSYAPYYWLT